ncbi:hypothetical protein HanRHA438_Chr16g0781251 [Helianthus annuus]|nr:hypothetical protein HanRHA438_Chr16g0781251 [Helianthus annuus]
MMKFWCIRPYLENPTEKSTASIARKIICRLSFVCKSSIFQCHSTIRVSSSSMPLLILHLFVSLFSL